uniref:C1q domain protein n=1 Tax=Pithovirus LCPAC406 TaxID=2506599 RepID=A0A481ZCY7_9VIRU|nr:MAG: uncharacterized protein LCPAC406_01270 [Pithovirus LCPAC406]
MIEWGQLFIAVNGAWVTSPQTEPYVFNCEADGTFYKVTPDKPARNFNDVVCARKFDTLFDCENQTFYTLTKIKLIPKGCELRWVEDCKIENGFPTFPLYANGDGDPVVLVFDTWITMPTNVVINGVGWIQSGPGVFDIPADGLYKLDFAVNINTTEGPNGTITDNVDIKYFVNGAEAGVLYVQQLVRSDNGEVAVDDQQLVSGSAVLSFTLGDTLEVRVKQSTNNLLVIQMSPILSSITAFKVDKIP